MPAPTYADLEAFVKAANVKPASTLAEPADKGKPVSEGAHGAEQAKRLKDMVPHNNVESGKDNPATGQMNNPVPHSGLLQTTVGEMPEVEKAVKEVSDTAEKLAALDLTTDEGFAAGTELLRKGAAALPLLFIQAGINTAPAAPTQAQPAVANAPADKAAVEKAARDAKVATVIDQYRNLGADRGTLTSQWLIGFHSTYDALTKMAEDGSMGAMLAADPAAAGVAPPATPAMPPEAPAPGPDAAQGGAPSTDDVAAALMEMGLTPDQVMEIAQKMQGELSAAPTEGAGAPSPEEKAAAADALNRYTKVAADAKQHMRAGRFAFKPAGDGSADRRRRDVAKAYFNELLQASK